jgi:hypothetical protein
MATRMNIMKLLQETRGLAQVTNRCPAPRSPATLALQIRPPALRGLRAPQKQVIRIAMQDPPDIPHPVKIWHLKESPIPIVLSRAP